MAAVLGSAAELFAERGPTATSIRDIAERAGVNHGLVFRHFGAKENLVGAVLDHLGIASADTGVLTRQSIHDPQLRLHWMVLARCILDGYPVGQLQERFPVMSQLLDIAREHHDDDRAAELAVAHLAAFELGWQLFGPFLRTASGLQDISDADLHRDIDRESRRILNLD